MDRRDEIDAGEDGGKTEHEDARHRKGDIRLSPYAVRRVEGPAGIGSAPGGKERDNDKGSPRQIGPPGKTVQPGKRHVPCPYHDRQKEIPEGDRDARDNEEKDHDDPMYRKDPVIGFLPDDLAGHDQIQTDQEPEQYADRKKGEGRAEILNTDPFMVGRHEPGEDAFILSLLVIEAFVFGSRVFQITVPSWCRFFPGPEVDEEQKEAEQSKGP
jgi:hypothetical protein